MEKKITVSRKKAKILTVNRKSPYPIETLPLKCDSPRIFLVESVTGNLRVAFCLCIKTVFFQNHYMKMLQAHFHTNQTLFRIHQPCSLSLSPLPPLVISRKTLQSWTKWMKN